MLLLKRKLEIKRNVLLRGGEPTLSLDEARELLTAIEQHGETDHRLRDLSTALSSAEQVHALYGESGLFQLFFFAMANSHDFDHFYEVIGPLVGLLAALPRDAVEPLQYDNSELRAGTDLGRFNSHVMIPSLSRKLYNPGRHHGYLVYGIGEPRILVSLPFKGSTSDNYDVYNHSVDVVTSLMTRGYHGSFLLLDNLTGLNQTVAGVPAWLLWFSLVAGHSDLVVFIRTESELTAGQRREAEYTPDRVQKKIVDLPAKELKWAKASQSFDGVNVMYFQKGGQLTREEYLELEAAHAMPLIKGYSQPVGHRDGLVRFDTESGSFEVFPADYGLYS